MAKRTLFEGPYANMEFPEYEFQEYPKYVQTRRTDENGKPIFITVGSKAEELKMIDEIVPVEELDSVQKERDLLARNLELANEQKRLQDEEFAKMKAELEALKAPKEAPEAKPAPVKAGVKI